MLNLHILTAKLSFVISSPFLIPELLFKRTILLHKSFAAVQSGLRTTHQRKIMLIDLCFPSVLLTVPMNVHWLTPRILGNVIVSLVMFWTELTHIVPAFTKSPLSIHRSHLQSHSSCLSTKFLPFVKDSLASFVLGGGRSLVPIQTAALHMLICFFGSTRC